MLDNIIIHRIDEGGSISIDFNDFVISDQIELLYNNINTFGNNIKKIYFNLKNITPDSFKWYRFFSLYSKLEKERGNIIYVDINRDIYETYVKYYEDNYYNDYNIRVSVQYTFDKDTVIKQVDSHISRTQFILNIKKAMVSLEILLVIFFIYGFSIKNGSTKFLWHFSSLVLLFESVLIHIECNRHE